MGCVVCKSSYIDENRIGSDNTSHHIKHSLNIARSSLSKDKKDAAELLCMLAKRGDLVRQRIAQEGGVITLVKLFRSKSRDVQGYALEALCELAKSSACISSVLEDDGWLPMLLCLQHKNLDLQEVAWDGLLLLSESEYGNTKLVLEGTASMLVQYVSQRPEDDMKVLQLLFKFSIHSQNIPRMIEDGVLEHVFNVIHSSVKGVDHKILSMQILSQLCQHGEGQTAILRVNGNTGLQRMVAMLSFHNEELSTNALAAVLNLAKNSAVHRVLVKCGILHPLEKILKSKISGKTCASLNVLIMLAQHVENQYEMAHSGLLRKIINICSSGAGEEENLALTLLAILSRNERNRPQIIAQGGLTMLKELLDIGVPPKVAIQSKEIMGNLIRLFDEKRSLVPKAADKFLGKLANHGSKCGEEEFVDDLSDVFEEIQKDNVKLVASA